VVNIMCMAKRAARRVASGKTAIVEDGRVPRSVTQAVTSVRYVEDALKTRNTSCSGVSIGGRWRAGAD
jgi:hypothetical protein